MSGRLFVSLSAAGLAAAFLLAPASGHGQATANPHGGQAGATLATGAVRPVPDPSQPCRHGADGSPGPAAFGAPACSGGVNAPLVGTGAQPPPPFTGGVFGSGGRGPDHRAPAIRDPA